MDTEHLTLQQVPKDERPRERMLKQGAEALSNSELLAILLRTGTYQESVVQLAQRLLSEAGGLRHLVGMSTHELTKLKGIGTAKALQIQSGIELGRRLASSTEEKRFVIRSPEDVHSLMAEQLRYLKKEYFVCLFLNTKNQVMNQETLSIGSLNASIVHPREVFRAAISRGSASIICVHNHPSGDPTPSPEDIQITRRLLEAGELIGIEVLDHIIIGDERCISLKQEGLM